jgi:hypothetical protein
LRRLLEHSHDFALTRVELDWRKPQVAAGIDVTRMTLSRNWSDLSEIAQ